MITVLSRSKNKKQHPEEIRVLFSSVFRPFSPEQMPDQCHQQHQGNEGEGEWAKILINKLTCRFPKPCNDQGFQEKADSPSQQGPK